MSKITFMGAGSAIFAKNILGDCMMTPALAGFEFALYDIDHKRLQESKNMLINLKENLKSDVIIKAYGDRREALSGTKYIINAIQVGGYKPSTVIDFDIPSQYGLRQTIADTVGIGGIFRALRTIPVMMDFAHDIEAVAPSAWLLNYTNPMATLTGTMLHYTNVKTIGLCHSVQVCTDKLLQSLDMDATGVEEKIAGINHMAWLLEVKRDGKDLYPEIKRRAAEKQKKTHDDMVRFEMMNRFGYYVTESSEHNAEYHPYFIKNRYPALIEKYNIPLDLYLKRCEKQIKDWEAMRDSLVDNQQITHEKTHEYGARIIEAMETNVAFKFGGSVLNTGGLISNLPRKACVEVSCIADRGGIVPCYIGDIPEQLAALNRTNINTQLLTIEAAVTKKKEAVYQAAMLDPHTSAELSMDDIVALCDDLIKAHGEYLFKFVD